LHLSVAAVREPRKHEYAVLPVSKSMPVAHSTVHEAPLGNEPLATHPEEAAPLILEPKDDGRVQLDSAHVSVALLVKAAFVHV